MPVHLSTQAYGIASESDASGPLSVQNNPEIFRTQNACRFGEFFSARPGRHIAHPTAALARSLESQNVTALAATTGQNGAAALGAGADEEAVRAGTLGLGRLIGTLGSHDYFPAVVGCFTTALPFVSAVGSMLSGIVTAGGSPRLIIVGPKAQKRVSTKDIRSRSSA